VSENKAVFPNGIWDGLSVDRSSILFDRSPSYEDWDQAVAEIIALERAVIALGGGGSVDFVTSVALAAPDEFSVTGSPVTTTGTLTLTKSAQAAHSAWMGPTSGSPAAPSFRSIVAGDLPSHSHAAGDITSGTLAYTLLPVFAGSTPGAVPTAFVGDAGKFLKSDGTWADPATVGTVTSVDLAVPVEFTISGNPITTAGTITISTAPQTAHNVWAGPTTGSPAVPTFRTLVASDLPSHSHSGGDITSGTVAAARLGLMTGDSGSGGASGAVPAPASGDAGAGKFLHANGSWQVPSGSGTVTSVDVTGNALFNITGNPISTSGVINIDFQTQTEHKVFAGPSGGGVPVFRLLAAGDLPTHTHDGGDIASGTVAAARLGLMTGDLGSGGASGAVPAPGAGDAAALKFLRADGVWGTTPDSGGTVTSIDINVPTDILSSSGGPIATNGIITLSKVDQAANKFFAGPTTGADASPVFRTIVAGDLPSHVHSGADITSGTVGRARLETMLGDSGSGGASGAVPAPSAGDAAANRYLSAAGTWTVPATNPGTVTSVGFTAPAIFSVTGSPITGSGTIAVGLSNATANTVFAGPSTGSPGTPSFRVLVAADLPSHVHSGSDITSGTVDAARLGLMVGDSGSGGASGAVPAPGAGDATAGKYLKADGTWSTPPDNGTVTSVALAMPSFITVSGSPVTTNGTLTGSLANQNANVVFAGPSTGSPAAPTFRSLVAADIPAHGHSGSDITSGTVDAARLGVMTGDSGSGGASGAVPAPAAGDAAGGKFLKADGTWSLPPDNGTVTSVALAVPSEFSVSGSPITTTGTITVSKANQNANIVFAGPTSGGAAAPTFRALVAADIPTHVHSGSDITSGTVDAARLGLMTGDSGSGGASGAVPAPGAGDTAAGKFLKANGLWVVPSFVTSVALSLPSIITVSGSPITSSGTLTGTLATQSPNTVWAGPNSGVTALAPTFRALVALDLPTHTHSGADITSGTVAAARLGVMTGDSGSGGASGAVPAPAAGDNAAGRFLKANGTWSVPAGTATVTSVALALPGSVFSVTGSPITTSGTLTGAFTTQTANTIFAGPTSGSAAAPAFRAAVLDDIAAPLLTAGDQNYVINGAFRIFQRGGSSFTDDTYALDRWNILTQTAAVTVSQLAAPLVFGTMNYCRLTQPQASAQRMGLCQILEAAHAQDFNIRNMSLQFMANASTSYTLRSAILGWTGTADAVTSDVVNDWTSATYTASNFFIGTVTVLSVAQHSITTTGTLFKNEYTWSGSTQYNNIIVFFWTESTVAQNVTLNIADVGLYAGFGTRRFEAPPMAVEIQNCRRFYEKSYALTTAPASTTNNASFSEYAPKALTVNGSLVAPAIRYVSKVKAPAVTIYNPNSGATGSLRDINAGNDQNCQATSVTTDTFEVTTNGATTIALGDLLRFHWVANAEL